MDLNFLFRDIRDGVGRKVTKASIDETLKKYSQSRVQENAANYHDVFLQQHDDSVTGLQYREIRWVKEEGRERRRRATPCSRTLDLDLKVLLLAPY